MSLQAVALGESTGDNLDEFDVIEDPLLNIATHSQLTIEGRQESEITTISLWDVARNYRVHVTAIEGLVCGAAESVYVEACIYHGGVPMCQPLRTH